MNRGHYAGSGYEGAEYREKKSDYEQDQVPLLEHLLSLLDHYGVKKRGGGEPGHERRVFDRVPRPVSSPAELKVGPPGSEKKTGAQEHPGKKGVLSRVPYPPPSEFPAEKRPYAESERNGDSHVPDVKRKGMNGHVAVLENRVESPSLAHRRAQGLERFFHVGDKKEEKRRHGAQNGRHVRVPSAFSAPYHRKRRVEGKNEAPEKQRTRLSRPKRRHPVYHGEVRAGVERHVLYGEIKGDQLVEKATDRDREKKGNRQNGVSRASGESPAARFRRRRGSRKTVDGDEKREKYGDASDIRHLQPFFLS